MTSMPTAAEMQRAVQKRDAAYDGLFLFAVRTTGVFCRPTCPARRARPENVEYFADAPSAQRAGYRPCLRCQPLQQERPAWVQAMLAELEQDPELRLRDADLAARGLDPGTVRRWFRRHFGTTFQQYARERRLARSWQQLERGDRLDDVILDSGFDSHSGFRDAFVRAFGAPPVRGAHGERAEPVLWESWPSPLGLLVAAATAEGICLLEFGLPARLARQLARMQRWFRGPVLPGTNAHLRRLGAELAEYFAGTRREFTGPLVLRGTEFQRRVWAQLCEIPAGETRSYEQIAVALGVPGAVRAVGAANGANRVALLVPCHRVVAKDGTLGGYGGGLARKHWLLAHEQALRG